LDPQYIWQDNIEEYHYFDNFPMVAAISNHNISAGEKKDNYQWNLNIFQSQIFSLESSKKENQTKAW
jgi:hypothetical protein